MFDFPVVWNPWFEKAKQMSDFGDDEVKKNFFIRQTPEYNKVNYTHVKISQLVKICVRKRLVSNLVNN